MKKRKKKEKSKKKKEKRKKKKDKRKKKDRKKEKAMESQKKKDKWSTANRIVFDARGEFENGRVERVKVYVIYVCVPNRLLLHCTDLIWI